MVPIPDLESILFAIPPGSNNFKITEKRNGKYNEYDKEYKVEPNVGGNIIQYFRVNITQ